MCIIFLEESFSPSLFSSNFSYMKFFCDLNLLSELQWTGMGNQELLDCFSDYAALKARHSYGPHGHRGMSVLIFEASTAGYLESVRLHKHFREQGRDKEAWNHCKNLFVPGGKRQLYGYLASKEDLDVFNRHSRGLFSTP